jgi:predicted nucleic acid-binding protein
VRRYLIDTTPLAAYLFNRPGAIALITPWMEQREATTSVLVYGEVVEYIRRRPPFAERHAQLRRLLRDIPPYFLNYTAMERYADIRLQLRRQGPGLIGDVDTLIAATALEGDLTVVTTDKDFQRVAGLKVLLLSRADLGLS